MFLTDSSDLVNSLYNFKLNSVFSMRDLNWNTRKPRSVVSSRPDTKGNVSTKFASTSNLFKDLAYNNNLEGEISNKSLVSPNILQGKPKHLSHFVFLQI